MNAFERQYFKLVKMTVDRGDSDNRVKHHSSFSLPNGRISLNLITDCFPVLTGRKFDFSKSLVETIGSLRGINNADWYKERGCGFWKKFGISKTLYRQEYKTDAELVNEYCSYRGKYKPTDPLYMERYALLESRSHQDGRKLIDQSDITFWKNVMEQEKGSMGPTHAYLWRNWKKFNGENHDQLRSIFDQLKAGTENQQLTITGVLPTGMEEFHERYAASLSLKKNVRFPCHLSHTYCTVAIPFFERVALFLQKHPDQIPYANIHMQVPNSDAQDTLDNHQIPKYYLDLTWVQKNWDLMLGLPMNTASYAAILIMMAKLQNMVPRYLTGTASSMHIYKNHLNGASELIHRYEKKTAPKCKPQLIVNLRDDVTFIDQFETTDFELKDYKSLPVIKFNYIYDKR